MNVRVDMKHCNQLWGEIGATYHEAALRMGLSDSEMWILYTVCEGGGARPIGEIVSLSGICKQTVNSALRRMEEDGFIRLEAMDGKKKKAVLTESGQELAERTVLRVIDIENGIVGSWTEAEQAFYLELTERYLTALQEKTKEL